MKAFFRAIAFFLIFVLLFITVICAVPDQFEDAYHRAIVLQYDYYKTLGENKIVFLGSSGFSFGLDLDLLQGLTGRSCAILGNVYGDGFLFQTEIAKSNLHAGDVVVIEYLNYPYPAGEAYTLLSGVGKRYDMHRFFPKELLGEILRTYPSYFVSNLNYWRKWGYQTGAPYTMDSFDERGNISLYRGECELPAVFTEEDGERYGWTDFYSVLRGIDPAFIKYLNSFVTWCEERDIRVFFTLPCYYEASVPDYCGEEIMNEFDRTLQSLLTAPLISRSVDYVFPREYIYEEVHHCNTVGAQYRTRLLVRDLMPYLSKVELKGETQNGT